MLTLVPDDIERYVERHTTPLPPHLEDLVKFTVDEMDYSIMLSGTFRNCRKSIDKP